MGMVYVSVTTKRPLFSWSQLHTWSDHNFTRGMDTIFCTQPYNMHFPNTTYLSRTLAHHCGDIGRRWLLLFLHLHNRSNIYMDALIYTTTHSNCIRALHKRACQLHKHDAISHLPDNCWLAWQTGEHVIVTLLSSICIVTIIFVNMFSNPSWCVHNSSGAVTKPLNKTIIFMLYQLLVFIFINK